MRRRRAWPWISERIRAWAPNALAGRKHRGGDPRRRLVFCAKFGLAHGVQERALDESGRDIDLVGVEAHRTGHGADLRRSRLRRRLDVLALERVLDDRGAVRDWGDAAKCDASV